MTDSSIKDRQAQRAGSFAVAVGCGSLGLAGIPKAVSSSHVEVLILTGGFLLMATIALVNGIFSPPSNLFTPGTTRRQRLITTTLLVSVVIGMLVGFPLGMAGQAFEMAWLSIVGLVVGLVSLAIVIAISCHAFVSVVRESARAHHATSVDQSHDDGI
jgi:hypothetical protein